MKNINLASIVVYDEPTAAALEVLVSTNGILQFLYRKNIFTIKQQTRQKTVI